LRAAGAQVLVDRHGQKHTAGVRAIESTRVAATDALHSSTVVIGAGRVGRTVAARLAGARLVPRGDDPDLAGCDRLLIATPDGEIAGVCSRLAPRLPRGA